MHTLRPMDNEILSARTELGLSQEELAEELGVDRSTVTRWENGATKAPNPARRLVAEMLERHRKARGIAGSESIVLVGSTPE